MRLLLLAIMMDMAGVGLLGSFALPIYACIRWRGGWRWASFVPLAGLALLILPLIPAWMHDPSAYNLWGLLLLPLEAMMCVYMAVLLLLHWRLVRKSVAGG